MSRVKKKDSANEITAGPECASLGDALGGGGGERDETSRICLACGGTCVYVGTLGSGGYGRSGVSPLLSNRLQ